MYKVNQVASCTPAWLWHALSTTLTNSYGLCGMIVVGLLVSNSCHLCRIAVASSKPAKQPEVEVVCFKFLNVVLSTDRKQFTALGTSVKT